MVHTRRRRQTLVIEDASRWWQCSRPCILIPRAHINNRISPTTVVSAGVRFRLCPYTAPGLSVVWVSKRRSCPLSIDANVPIPDIRRPSSMVKRIVTAAVYPASIGWRLVVPALRPWPPQLSGGKQRWKASKVSMVSLRQPSSGVLGAAFIADGPDDRSGDMMPVPQSVVAQEPVHVITPARPSSRRGDWRGYQRNVGMCTRRKGAARGVASSALTGSAHVTDLVNVIRSPRPFGRLIVGERMRIMVDDAHGGSVVVRISRDRGPVILGALAVGAATSRGGRLCCTCNMSVRVFVFLSYRLVAP